MQRLLILTLFFLIAVGPLTAQIKLISQADTLPRPTVDTTQFTEYTGEYTNDYPEEKASKNRTQIDIPMVVGVGLGGNQIFIKDNLISPYAYNGFGLNLSSFVENVNYEKRIVHLGTEVVYQLLRNDFTRNGKFYNNFPIRYLEYMEINIPFEYKFRLAQSPHYVGFQLNYLLTSISVAHSNGNFSTPTSDHYSSIGAAYLYRNEVLGIPIRASATLPVFAVGFYNQDYTKFNTFVNYFKPDIQLDLLAKKFKEGHIRVSYQCKYFNTNRGVDMTFRQRHFQNLINVSYVWAG